MGIFSGLFKSRDKPQNRTAGSNYAFFFGGTTSGKAVTERSAMQMTAVYSCVRILSEAVAGLPLHLYKYTDSGSKAMALDHGNDGLRVAIRFDGAIKQLHLLRGNTVGVVVVCVDLFNGYPLDLMNGLI